MKKFVLIACSIFAVATIKAQLKATVVCPPFSVDILKGKVNDLRPSSTVNEIRNQLPCFTSAIAESDSARCGGGVFYRDKDISFYTARNYVEIGPNFKGKLSLPLMGASRNSLYKWLGHPEMKDPAWEAFQTEYGILILYYNKASKVNKIQFSTESTGSIRLCQ